MIEHCKQLQISDCNIAMNEKRVAGLKLLVINEHKFSRLPNDDPQRLFYMQELRIMNQVLAKEAINTLTTSEQDIINQTMFNSETRKLKASEFVDLTIATALDYSSYGVGLSKTTQGACGNLLVKVFLIKCTCFITYSRSQQQRLMLFGCTSSVLLGRTFLPPTLSEEIALDASERWC